MKRTSAPNRAALLASVTLLLTACATDAPKAALPTVMPGLKGVVSFGARQEPIDYTYRNPFLGINSVARKVGEMSFDAISRQPTAEPRETVAKP
jgi:hypothetical protein